MAGGSDRVRDVTCVSCLLLFLFIVLGPRIAVRGPLLPLLSSRSTENPIQPPAQGKIGRGDARLAKEALHPLDPLTFIELETVRKVLLDEGLIEDGHGHVHGVQLLEPSKATVLAWSKGNALPAREARVNTWRNGELRKLVVDVTSKKVVKNELYTGSGKPMITDPEVMLAAKLPFKYPPFLESVAKRKLPLDRALCLPLSGGWYNKEIDGNRRILRLACYDQQYTNYIMQPLEGITIFVDLDTQEIYEYFDKGPLPQGNPAFINFVADELEMDGPLDEPFKPISIEQPAGVNFKVDGYSISWAKWKFHAAPDPRAGLIISRVTYNDTVTKTVREVLYQGHLSEMFVPYQDPSTAWFYRTYMDVGEYGFGMLSMGLTPLNDCPRNAHYVDAVLPDANGNPFVVPNMMCIFERYSGDYAWRHTEPFGPIKSREVRPKVTLVARQTATIGNYDYTIDWEFQTDGLIRVSVTMSGMVTVKSIAAAGTWEVPNGEKLHGTMVNDHTVAVAHDHFINFRLDMDVDGQKNSFVEGKLVTQRLPEGTSWRTSIWDVEKTTALTERQGQYNASSTKPAEYFIVNEGSKTRLGNSRSYKIVPHTSGVPLLAEDDFPQIRAAWTKNSMWVTPYDAEQRWAGGEFPNQQHGEDTLATWTLKNRPVENTDIVVWYNVAYHHFPVQEDFPVMPATIGGFEIKPANFFELNPTIRAQAFTAEELPTCALSKGLSFI